MKKEIHIVTIDTIRVWDDFQKSYLPVMHKVFGVYKSEQDAKNDVWRYFGTDEYDYGVDGENLDVDLPYYDDLFIRTDKVYGGRACYCVNYNVEFIEI